MSTEPYRRKQGELELRVLKDGRLVVVAPDEAMLEIARAFTENGGSRAAVPGEQNAETGRAERRQSAGDGRADGAADG